MPSASAAVIQPIVITVLTLTIQIKIDVNFIKFMLGVETAAQSFDIGIRGSLTTTVAVAIGFF